MTTCKDLGWKVGDKFRVEDNTSHGFINGGDILTLVQDDGSEMPFFSGSSVDGWEDMVSCSLSRLKKITPNKYVRIIHGVEVDVYDILKAFEVTCPATQHAIKKLLMPGQRGSKNKLQDLKEAKQAIKQAIELNIREILNFMLKY